MIPNTQPQINACLARLRGSARGDLLALLITASGKLIAWQGAGTDEEIAALGLSIARVIGRAGTSIGSRSGRTDQDGPPLTLTWHRVEPHGFLVLVGKDGSHMQAAVQRMPIAASELHSLLPDPLRSWQDPRRWSMP